MTIGKLFCIIKKFVAGLCKGSTTDSDSVCLGSNPSPAAKRIVLSFQYDSFIVCYQSVLSLVFLLNIIKKAISCTANVTLHEKVYEAKSHSGV